MKLWVKKPFYTYFNFFESKTFCEQNSLLISEKIIKSVYKNKKGSITLIF